MDAARRSQPAWAALAADERAARVVAAAEAGVAAVEAGDLARLLTREHGKTHLEAIFDTATMGGMAAAFAPLVAEALAARRAERRGDPDRVGAARRRGGHPALQLAGLGHGQQGAAGAAGRRHRRRQGAADLPGHGAAGGRRHGRGAAAGRAQRRERPRRRARRRRWWAIPASTWCPSPVAWPPGRRSWPRAAASTRPVVLELGGNDAAILAPDVDADRALADRIVEAAFVTSGQVCMAIKRLYVHRDRMDETVDALAGRLATEVVGDGLAEDVTMGPVHTASARDRVEAMLAEAGAAGPPCSGRVGSGPRTRDRGLLRLAGARGGAGGGRGIVREEQFAPALPVIPYDDLDEAVDAANDTTFGLCASVWSNDDALAADVASRLSAGTVFVNAHGISAIDMYAPMGGWKQSGFGVELGPEGMQAFARQRVRVRRPAPGGQGAPA